MRFVVAPADRRLVRGAVARRPGLSQAGDEIGVGSVIGLIEAMKLFNEIKSDVGGKVTRTLVESGHAGQAPAAADRG